MIIDKTTGQLLRPYAEEDFAENRTTHTKENKEVPVDHVNSPFNERNWDALIWISASRGVPKESDYTQGNAWDFINALKKDIIG